jgi:hypothetical protein
MYVYRIIIKKMQNQSKMKKLFILVLPALFFLLSCQKDNPVNVQTKDSASNQEVTTKDQTASLLSCSKQKWPLWAGRKIPAGNLTVENDAKFLYVTYTTTGSFNGLHLWAGINMNTMPMTAASVDKKTGKVTAGVPVPGKFPYKFEAAGANTYTFKIALSSISGYARFGDKVYVVAHAETVLADTTETSFGGTKEENMMDAGRWYYWDVYQTVACTLTNG